MWSGYGGDVNDDDGGVWDRLQAVWQAEKEYDLTYISTWVSFAPGAVQRIRLPSEVLDQNSGNCIELAMLYAAAAEAMDLEAALILIPGHAFVGIRTDQENANYYFVETTMIGQNSFSQAVDRAKVEFDDALPHIDAKEPGYGWVQIWDARAAGILPVPWH
jgi:transglutaminase-like putative cysteine protease